MAIRTGTVRRVWFAICTAVGMETGRFAQKSFRPKVVSHTVISPTPESRFTQIRSCFAHRLGQKHQNEFKYDIFYHP